MSAPHRLRRTAAATAAYAPQAWLHVYSPVRAQNNCRGDGKNEYQQTVDSLTGYRTFWEIKSLGTKSMYKEKRSRKPGRSLEGRADVNHALVAVAEGRP